MSLNRVSPFMYGRLCTYKKNHVSAVETRVRTWRRAMAVLKLKYSRKSVQPSMWVRTFSPVKPVFLDTSEVVSIT
jgi:hypothetical protein